jgi:hypothetical protein
MYAGASIPRIIAIAETLTCDTITRKLKKALLKTKHDQKGLAGVGPLKGPHTTEARPTPGRGSTLVAVVDQFLTAAADSYH